MARTGTGIAVLLLAAGRSERFGGGKPAALLGGRPLIHHAAAVLAALPVAHRIAIVGSQVPDLGTFGFTAIAAADPDQPLSASLRQGVAAASGQGASAVLVALGDMPFVGRDHFLALIEAFDGNRIASLSSGVIGPPAILGARFYPDLLALRGDRGAGTLLRGAPTVTLSAAEAVDIDTRADLAAAELRFG